MKQKNVILMVVAVGCGLVAAFLTSQMSAKPTIEQVDVIVAAKDLAVGTTISREDLDKVVKIKKISKDALPPTYIQDKEALVDKRLSRPVRAEETFNPQDLVKGGAITLPPGYGMVSMPVGAGQAAAGFVGPGSRVDVLATIRLTHKLHSFPLLVNMLVVAVNTATTYQQENGGAFPNVSMVSFAVKGKEALVLSLAKTRGCNLELLLRHPETSDPNEKNDKIEDVIKLLTDDKEEVKVVGNDKENPKGVKDPGTKTGDPVNTVVKPNDPTTKPTGPDQVPPPRIASIKVMVAKHDVAPNTLVTNDLLTEAFEWKEVPKDFATDALADNNYEEALGKVFKTGVSKNQWLTWTMIGVQAPKTSPREYFNGPKPGPNEVVKVEPVKPIKRNHHDVAVHTNSRTVIHRYEEVAPGNWKKVAELTPEQANRDRDDEPETPKGAPNSK